MARSTTLLVILLLSISFVALLSMHHLSLRNGMLAHRSGFNLPGAYLPNTSIPIHVGKTGIRVLDEYVALMVSIFWVDLDPRNVVAHIQGTHFLGTLTGTWILMLVEASRVDASHSFLLTTVFVETVGELIGLGFMTPIWCLLHITAFQTSQPRRLSVQDSLALPLAFVLGHILPTVMMVLCDPAGEGAFSQQNWVLLRLFHAFLTYALWILVRSFTSFFSSSSTIPASSPRTWYITALLLATTLHWLSLAPVLMLRLSPGWLQPSIVQQLDLFEIFVPAPFWILQVPKVESFAQGVSHFLQWDELLTGVAILAWALGQGSGQGFVAEKKKIGFEERLGKWGFVALVLGLGGPAAAAAWVLLECERVEGEGVGDVDREKKVR